ncbi:Hypothetical predicted protein [Octopus vulgaris]|uniref:Uncharacterized protein n=1 Tax=Octopus vulgaris TaxID=6645 RepID=A0AA36BD68_OCTVU|nr:Hypothetical predicted protein [Octopus vulgaris]
MSHENVSFNDMVRHLIAHKDVLEEKKKKSVQDGEWRRERNMVKEVDAEERSAPTANEGVGGGGNGGGGSGVLGIWCIP